MGCQSCRQRPSASSRCSTTRSRDPQDLVGSCRPTAAGDGREGRDQRGDGGLRRPRAADRARGGRSRVPRRIRAPRADRDDRAGRSGGGRQRTVRTTRGMNSASTCSARATAPIRRSGGRCSSPIRNVGGGRPGARIGPRTAARQARLRFAERLDETSPWPGLAHARAGLRDDETGVTLFAGEVPRLARPAGPRARVAGRFARRRARARRLPAPRLTWDAMLVLGPEHGGCSGGGLVAGAAPGGAHAHLQSRDSALVRGAVGSPRGSPAAFESQNR